MSTKSAFLLISALALSVPTISSAQSTSDTGDHHLAIQSGVNTVSFKSQGYKLSGNLYVPHGFEPTRRYLAVIFSGPFNQIEVKGASHVSLYDIDKDVDQAVEKMVQFFSKY